MKELYTIRDPYFSLTVYGNKYAEEHHRPWWWERWKLEKLITAFKSGHTVKAACFYTNISIDQYKYFIAAHPSFSTIKDDLRELQFLRAMDTVNNNMDDPKTARWFLSRRHPDFSNKLKVDLDQPLSPTTNEPVSTGAVDTTEITKALEGVAREFLAKRAS